MGEKEFQEIILMRFEQISKKLEQLKTEQCGSLIDSIQLDLSYIVSKLKPHRWGADISIMLYEIAKNGIQLTPDDLAICGRIACDELSMDEAIAALKKIDNALQQRYPERYIHEEQTEPSPTVASAERIVTLETDNAGMRRGKWQFMAEILNRKLQYDAKLQPWTADSIKKAWQRAARSERD